MNHFLTAPRCVCWFVYYYNSSILFTCIFPFLCLVKSISQFNVTIKMSTQELRGIVHSDFCLHAAWLTESFNGYYLCSFTPPVALKDVNRLQTAPLDISAFYSLRQTGQGRTSSCWPSFNFSQAANFILMTLILHPSSTNTSVPSLYYITSTWSWILFWHGDLIQKGSHMVTLSLNVVWVQMKWQQLIYYILH